jgi:sulfite reductase beta subunit-like hemoprotein
VISWFQAFAFSNSNLCRYVAATLAAGGVKDASEIDPIDATSIACPALPLCGLAITEVGLCTLNHVDP